MRLDTKRVIFNTKRVILHYKGHASTLCQSPHVGGVYYVVIVKNVGVPIRGNCTIRYTPTHWVVHLHYSVHASILINRLYISDEDEYLYPRLNFNNFVLFSYFIWSVHHVLVQIK